MKKLIISAAVIVVLAVAGIVLFRPESPLDLAETAERRGDFATAREKYLEALLENTDGIDLPDKNRSKIVTPESWYGEVAEYMSWVTSPASTPAPEASRAYIGAQKCSSFVESQHYYTDDSVFAHEEDFTFTADWRRAFFPAGVSVKADHGPLVMQAMQKGISILRISALTSYTYTASLLDLSSWKRVDFVLAPEDDVSLLVRSGRYALVSSSEVEFPDGTLWRSPKNLLYVDAPDTCCTKTFVLKTRVKRGG